MIAYRVLHLFEHGTSGVLQQEAEYLGVICVWCRVHGNEDSS